MMEHNLDKSKGVFFLVCAIVSVRLLARVWQQAMHLGDVSLADSFGPSFLMAAGAHGVIALIAFLYNRLFKIPSAFLYLSLYLALYLFVLLNGLTFHVNERGLLLSLIALLLVYAVKSVVEKRVTIFTLPRWQDVVTWPNVLIILCLAHGFLYFCEGQTAGRLPYGDENSLWFTASAAMMKNGIAAAHHVAYPGAGVHPLSVPFIASLPGILAGAGTTSSIFFLPIVTFIALAFFLCSIRQQPWTILFFVTGLFVTFHNRSWLAQLCYHLVYAESFALVLFLAASFAVYTMASPEAGRRSLILAAFGFGLVYLSKSPVMYFAPVFLLALVYALQEHRGALKAWWAPVAAFSVPAVVWTAYKHIGQVPGGANATIESFLSRILAPNTQMLTHINVYIQQNAEGFVYMGCLSVLFIVIAFSKKEYAFLWPSVALVLSVGFYYAYVYYYNEPGGDYESALRYVMPVALGLYFFGARAFERIMGMVVENAPKPWLGVFFQLMLCGLVVAKLF